MSWSSDTWEALACPPSSSTVEPRTLPVDQDFMRGADGAVEAPLPVQRPERGYMTAAGAERYRLRLQELMRRRGELLEADDDDLHARAERGTVEREIAQISSVLQGAIVIRLASPPRDAVRFGATVEVEDDRGMRRRFQLVGEPETTQPMPRVAASASTSARQPSNPPKATSIASVATDELAGAAPPPRPVSCSKYHSCSFTPLSSKLSRRDAASRGRATVPAARRSAGSTMAPTSSLVWAR